MKKTSGGGRKAATAYVQAALRSSRRRKDFARERLAEPVHLNLASLPVLAAGSTRTKIAWDLIPRFQYAAGLAQAVEVAERNGIDRITAIEVGVAQGAGLMNMAHIAELLTEETGIDIEVVGFDTGKGMPPPRDYRDHPDIYIQGDYAMDVPALEGALPAHARLVIGELSDTVQPFLASLSNDRPVGFVALDVDYYYSTVDALALFEGPAEAYLPLVTVYLDDILIAEHNSRCGVLAAVNEYNETHKMRVIEKSPFYAKSRVFRRARWIEHMFNAHILDHPARQNPSGREIDPGVDNPFL